MIFLDSSAWAQAYLEEEGTYTMLAALKRMGGLIFISGFVALEVLTTLHLRLRFGPKAQYQGVMTRFFRDFPIRFNVVDVDAGIRREAMRLAVTQMQTSARAMDVLHAACALEVKAFAGLQVTMASSDRELLALSRALGLGTFNPRVEPLAALPRRD